MKIYMAGYSLTRQREEDLEPGSPRRLLSYEDRRTRERVELILKKKKERNVIRSSARSQ